MSITTIEPATRTTPAVLLHEDVWIEPHQVPAPRTTGKRFPENLRTKPAPGKQRCTLEAAPVATEPTASAPPLAGPQAAGAHPADAEADEHAVPAEVRPLIDKIFPKTEPLLNIEQSVASIIHAVAPAMLEVLAGARPAHQLVSALSPECMAKLEYHLEIGREQQPDPSVCCYSNPRVLRIRVSEILPLVFEAAVVLLDIHKVRATALRIERWHGRWQVTALELG